MIARVMPFLSLLLAFSPLLVHSWNLIDNFDGNTWSNGMWVETRTSNNEYVSYQNQDAALSSGLIQNRNGQLYLGVDSTSYLDPNGAGRKAVRIRSNKAYNAGTLVIGDFAHIPANVCGTWPSFWMVGPTWPQDGEIDIIEGVNQMSQNQITLHTRPGCVPRVGSGGQSGAITANADCGAGGGGVGCGVFNTKSTGWGTGFNSAGGGVYATLWTGSSIQIWNWPASQVPWDIPVGQPNPDGWGQPVANFVGCDFASAMNNMNIIVNTAFCGGWSGAVWGSASCAPMASTCQQYVAANPQAYSEAYWLINSIKVYQ